MIAQVTVKPGSKKGPLVEVAPVGDCQTGDCAFDDGGRSSADEVLTVYLHEKTHDGEANAGLVKLLAKHYGVAKSCVVIRSGEKSRKKVVEIIK